MKPDLIVEYLQRFPVALQNYLEYLVYDRKFEVWQMFEAFFSQHETTAIAFICDVSLKNYDQTHLHSLWQSTSKWKRPASSVNSYRYH